MNAKQIQKLIEQTLTCANNGDVKAQDLVRKLAADGVISADLVSLYPWF